MSVHLFAALALAGMTAACNTGDAGQRAGAVPEAAAPRAPAAPAAPAKPELPAESSAPAPAAPAAAAATPAAPAEAAAASAALPGADKGRRCGTDADCMVKDIGSCCGYQPQCLNKDTPTFPEQVKAKCAREGRVSVCGMLAISGCRCVSGTCENVLQSDESLPAAPAPLK